MPEAEWAWERGSIGIAGAGRMGQALGRLLRERGEPVVAVASRDPAGAAAGAAFIGGVGGVSYSELPAVATRVLIAVADGAIPEVARVLAEAGMTGGAALHTCGAFGPEALAPLASRGVSCGTLHPLQTVATPEQGIEALPGSAFAIDGEGPALRWAERIAHLLDGETLRIAPEHRVFYHAAAVMASNCVTGLVDAAVILMKAAGIEEEAALRAIGPLMRTSADNALRLGPIAALTGPIQRGDAATVGAHLAALNGVPKTVRELYRAAGSHVLEIARRRGLPEDQARRLAELVRGMEEHNA